MVRRSDIEGIDSQVWVFSRGTIELTVERGHYSGLPEIYKNKPGFRSKDITLSGKRAVLASFTEDRPGDKWRYISAVYFLPDLPEKKKISMYFRYHLEGESRTVKDIIKSVRFSN